MDSGGFLLPMKRGGKGDVAQTTRGRRGRDPAEEQGL